MSSEQDWTKPQPPPIRTEGPAVWPLVIGQLLEVDGYHLDVSEACTRALLAACQQRHGMGLRKYGVPLQVQNGRDPLRDLLDEALDASAYSRQQFERTRLVEDWELHVSCMDLAARVVNRLLQRGAVSNG